MRASSGYQITSASVDALSKLMLNHHQYEDRTATALAEQLLAGASDDTAIAVVSAPSVFIQLKNLTGGSRGIRPRLTLLEYDERFSVFKEFTFYDYQQPTKLPGESNSTDKRVETINNYVAELKGKFDRIICDPPFLSEECQTKGKHLWDCNHSVHVAF